MSKITVKHFPEDFAVRINQEGMPGLTINEGYLSLLVRALKDPKYRNIYYLGTFRVREESKSIIIDTVDRRVARADVVYRTLLIFPLEKSARLVEAIETQLSYVLSEYSEVMVIRE